MDNHDIAIERCNRRAAQAAIDLAAALEAGTTAPGTSEDGNPSLTYVFPSTLQMQAARDAWQHYALIQVDEPADVALTAAQRAAAQIGYELFGRHDLDLIEIANRVRELRAGGPSLMVDVQPGGRERLGDQVICTTELRRNAHVLVLQELRTRFTDAGSPSRTAALDAAISALSAQPSPGGQADARAQFEAWAESAGWYAVAYRPDRDAPYALNAVEFAWQAFQAALAARQPVGEPVAYIEHFADKVSRMEMTMTGLHLGIGRHPVYAAPPTQSVGEPVALGETDPIPCAWSDDDASSLVTLRDALRRIIAGTTTKDAAHFLKQPGQRRMTIKDAQEVATAHLPYVESLVHRSQGYAAPPAQAVDLGAVREALRAAEGLATICASVDGYSREEVAASGRAMRQQFADALALIDGKAVGK